MFFKRFLLTLLVFFSLFQSFGENIFSSAELTAEFSPALYLNPESKKVSAPSPFVYPLSIGFLWPKESDIAIQPSVRFFTMYHLWYDGQALPAEIENRTSQTFCLLLDVPAVFSLAAGEDSRFFFYAGTAVLMRFGSLASGVKGSDSGYSGSAEKDLDEINSYFWDKARFLYLSLGSSWLYNFSDHFRAGPVIHTYLPLGSFFNGEGVQAMIISAGLKMSFHF